MGLWRAVIALIFSTVILCLLALTTSAAENSGRVVATGFKEDRIELIGVLQVVESNNAQVAIDVPADATGQKIRMTLRSSSSRPAHRWAIFTLSNPNLVAHDFVLQLPRQGFVKSGVVWPSTNTPNVLSLSASTGPRPLPIGARSDQSYSLSVGPGITASFAIELTPILLRQATLWHRKAFEAQAGQLAFFNGVVLGIAVLLGVAILALFAVRPLAVFPAVGLFAWSIICFMMLNSGVLSRVSPQFAEYAFDPFFRGVIESIMVVGLSLSVMTILQLRKSAPTAGILMWVTTLVGIALTIYSFFDPSIVSGLARIVFVLVALTALMTALVLWYRGNSRAGSSLFVWIIIFGWTVLAAVGCLGMVESELLGPAIAVGQDLILISISFTLVQLIFGQSIVANHFLEDSGRRALALAGSEQSVWDWQVASKVLYVGPELERGLGLQSGIMGSVDLRRWNELIHPGDRSAYFSAVEAAEKRGKGPFSQEFRLRRADGTYRWYLLRARAITGEEQVASRLIGALTDVTAVKRSEDRLLADAVRDRVTGLPNRALFVDRLERALRRAGAKQTNELFVLIIDLDRFKNVNDGLGHEIGDSLLNVVGGRLARMIGPDDTLARLSGDQFGIIFNGESLAREIIEVSDNIRQIISVPINVRPREIFLTASIGVAQFEMGQLNPDALIKNAEIALYEAKCQGKDQIEFYRPTMNDERSQLVALESDLRRALDRNEIEVVYQPIKRLVDDQLAGFEALVRWRHPERGLLGPDSFLDMAEETGIIREVGRYVLNEAARKLGIWQRAFRPSDPLFVAVNVSRAQLLNYELVSELRALLSREDIVPGTLKLEITETMVMQNPELATKVLERASDLGVGIACDDFGTGYSALANLARLPFDTLKIDRAFLLEDGKTENATIIFDAITHLAHSLKLNVVAEGVESQDQLDRLLARGVDYAQGFFIGEPVSATRVIEALGGQPYTSSEPASAMSQLWARLLSKEKPPERKPDELPTASQIAREVAQMYAQDEPLEPWSPNHMDVSDPALEEESVIGSPLQKVAKPIIGAAPLAPRRAAKKDPEVRIARVDKTSEKIEKTNSKAPPKTTRKTTQIKRRRKLKQRRRSAAKKRA